MHLFHRFTIDLPQSVYPHSITSVFNFSLFQHFTKWSAVFISTNYLLSLRFIKKFFITNYRDLIRSFSTSSLLNFYITVSTILLTIDQ